MEACSLLSKTYKSDTLQPTFQVHATVLYKIFESTTYFLFIFPAYLPSGPILQIFVIGHFLAHKLH